jgi:glutathione-independent formaldehyde dehydrogenase
MKAVVYNGPRDVTVGQVDDPPIEQPTDALVKITTTNICGSDLHMYEGRTDFEHGRVFGKGVQRLQVGDWVCLPFNVACGFCANCNRGLTNYCLTAQPMENMAGAAYGFADMGPWQGGQAEMLRVPRWRAFGPGRRS